MKNQEELTTTELMDMLKISLREVSGLEVSNRNLPIALNKLKTLAQGSQAALGIAQYQAQKDKGGDVTRVLIRQLDLNKKILKGGSDNI